MLFRQNTRSLLLGAACSAALALSVSSLISDAAACCRFDPPRFDPPRIDPPSPPKVEIGGDVGKVVNPVVEKAKEAVVTTVEAAAAPTQAVVDVATGKKSAGEAVQDVVEKKGAEVSARSQLHATVHNQTNQAVVTGAVGATNAIGGNGDTVGGAIATGQAPASLLVNGAAAAGDAVGQTLQHGDPSYAASAPLAAALADAHARLSPLAKPLPEHIKRHLRAVHSAETLARARYVVGAIPPTLNSMINTFQLAIGRKGHAVVVGDIIVFTEEPGETPRDLWYWAHEVHHVDQYQRHGGIAQFANAYMKNGPAIEAEANVKGDAMLGVASKTAFLHADELIVSRY